MVAQTHTSRRGLLAAAAALPAAALALPAAADANRLLALNQQLEARETFWPRGMSDAETHAYDLIGMDLERQIAEAPCISRSDAEAKLHHVMRGLTGGPIGCEDDALQQVIEWLAGTR